MKHTLKIKVLRDVQIPKRKHTTDAGLDLYLPEAINIGLNETVKIPLGIAIQLPEFQMAQVIERSSTAMLGLHFAKAPIDAGYRGEIHAIVSAMDKPLRLDKGIRIAQLVITPIQTPQVEVVTELTTSERGTDGFGSSGNK